MTAALLTTTEAPHWLDTNHWSLHHQPKSQQQATGAPLLFPHLCVLSLPFLYLSTNNVWIQAAWHSLLVRYSGYIRLNLRDCCANLRFADGHKELACIWGWPEHLHPPCYLCRPFSGTRTSFCTSPFCLPTCLSSKPLARSLQSRSKVLDFE